MTPNGFARCPSYARTRYPAALTAWRQATHERLQQAVELATDPIEAWQLAEMVRTTMHAELDAAAEKILTAGKTLNGEHR